MAQDSNGAATSPLITHKPVLSRERARRLFMILGIVVAALLLIYGVFELIVSGKESTDDAQVAADVVPVSARVAGQIASVAVQENQLVHAGQLIAEIDPRDAQVKVAQATSDLDTARAQAAAADARLQITGATARGGLSAAQAGVESSRESVGSSESAINEARAAVARAQANAEKARLDFKRATELGEKGDISRAQVDAARAAHDSADADLAAAQARLQSATNAKQLAQANVRQAQGKLEQTSPIAATIRAAQADADLAHAKAKASEAALAAAQLNLSYTRIVAPADGIASRLSVHVGALVTPGQPIVQLVPQRTYLVANFKETQVHDMRPGQKVHIDLDAMHGKNYEGTVESISGGTGASFSLLPPDNASGNFVKVVQRVPVRIRWNGPTADRVPVGSSADVTVYTK